MQQTSAAIQKAALAPWILAGRPWSALLQQLHPALWEVSLLVSLLSGTSLTARCQVQLSRSSELW